MEEDTFLNGFEVLAEKEDQLTVKGNETAEGFNELYRRQNEYFSEQKRALNTTTLLTALALSGNNPMTDQVVEQSRQVLEQGQESMVRSQVAADRARMRLSGVGRLLTEANLSSDPNTFKEFDTAYNRLKVYNAQEKERIAIEEAAVEKIRDMAVSDPVQAKIILDNLEYGTADQTVSDWAVKTAVLRQRAEELDDEYQQMGWGKWLLNTVLNFMPLNFNFQRTGTIGTAGIFDLLTVGSTQQSESNTLWAQASQMSNEEFAKFAAKDGPLMESVRDNATTLFDMTYDPSAAVEILDGLLATGDQDALYNNIWGGVEVASILPYKSLTSATRMLVNMGDAKSAARNIDNALHVLDNMGPEQMTRATGVTEKELAEELSVSAIHPRSQTEVPLGQLSADRRAAAQKAIDELFNTPDMPRFFSPEEAEAYLEGRIKEITRQVGAPVKDVKYVTESLPGGQAVTRVTFTVGKKDGHGFATQAAANRAVRAMGLDSAEVVKESRPGIKPPETKLTKEAVQVDKESGNKVYIYKAVDKDGNESKIFLNVDSEGTGKIDIQGLSDNLLGTRETRALAAQLADEIPDLKVLTGRRVTGARGRSGEGMLNPEVNVEKLRGQIATFRDHSGQWFARITKDMPEAGWLVGKLEPEQRGFIGRTLGRWFSAAARTSDPTLHGMALEAGSYLNRAARHIDNEVMGIFRALPKDSRRIVGEIGEIQAIKEKWLTEPEIHAVIERNYGRRANEVELNAIKDLRLFNDMDWELRNTAMYVDGLQKGKESVKFTSKWGEDFDEDVIIDYNMEIVPTERVYDASRNKHYVHGRNPLDTKTITTMKNNGYVMMTFPEGFHLPEGVVVNKVLIKKSHVDIKPLRREQLAYAEGGHRMYAPRHGGVFIKQAREGVQKDTGSKYLLSPSTFVVAENIAEGRKWAAVMDQARLALKENPAITAVDLDEQFFKQQQGFPTGEEFLEGVADGTYALDHPFEAVYDRELPSLYNKSGEDVARFFNEDELGINGYYRTTGRMYTSSKGEILRNTKGELPELLDPYETLSRSLHQVTRQLGLYNYKLNALERFANTYKRWLDVPVTGSNPARILQEARVIDSAPLEIKNQIEAQRAAIQNVLRFETPAERTMRQIYQSAAERAIGDGTNGFRKIAHDAIWWWKDNNPVSVLRGMAFDMKLGMFNPGQLLVQASTMLSATALSPKYGLYGMGGLMPMHAYVIKRGSENVLDLMAKRGVWKSMGFDTVDEFKDYARHMYKHGFMEMNGSHIMVGNNGPNAHFGTFAEKQARAREQARVFFYTSETWNRLVAYRIAWGEAKDKGLSTIDPQFNATVLRLADDYSFNMTNESAAFWQKGILSLPTQFWAYNMRMIEAMFGKRFTPAQRIRLIGMQLGMAGTAGIPGVQALSEYIKQQNGDAPDIDSLAGLADRGLIDYINYQLTGQDVLIGERVGTGGWASDVVKNMFGASEYGVQSMDEMLGGATWAITKNTSKTLWNLGKYAIAESGDQGVLGQITKDQFINTLKEVSTFGNAAKAMMIHQYGMLKSNAGAVQVSGLPEGNAVYQALSFRPAKADEMSYLQAYRQNKAEALKDYTRQLRNWRQEALNTGDYEKYWKKANVVINLIPYQDRREVLSSVNGTMDQSYYDFLERKVSEEQTENELIEELK